MLILLFDRSKKSDVPFIFRLWCNSMDQCYKIGQKIGPRYFRFSAFSADLYRAALGDLPPLADVEVDAFNAPASNLNLAPISEPGNERKPSSKIVSRLEAELGFKISGLENLESDSSSSSDESENLPLRAMRKKKLKRKRPTAGPKKVPFKIKFVSDNSIEFIRDLKKSTRRSISTSPVREIAALGKRKRKKTWKLQLSEEGEELKSELASSASVSATESDALDDDDDDDVESFSSDEYDPKKS